MGTTRVLKTSVYLRFNSLTQLLARQSFTELSHCGNFRWHNVENCGASILCIFLKVLQVSNWSVLILFIATINSNIQGATERTPLFGKLIFRNQRRYGKCFFHFWKVHRMPFYIDVFWTKHHSSGSLEYWYTDVASLGSCPWPWESFQV